MPVRKTPLVTNYYYHLFNRSVAKVPIFTSKNDYFRALNLLEYYRFKKVPIPFSKFNRLSISDQTEVMKKLKIEGIELVEIICFCLMSNHFHLLLKQIQDEGITIYLKKFQDGYAKYFNIKYQRVGSLFQNRFKAVLIEDENQLLHVSRYVHLNPYTSLVVKKKKDLQFYQWSSLYQCYLIDNKGFCKSKIILGRFKSTKDYLEFILDQADYQRNLQKIMHLTCE